MTRRAIWMTRASILALLPLAACARTETMADNGLAKTEAAAQAQMNPTLSTADTYFIDQATRSGLATVQSSEMAQKQARRSSVRSLAATMIKDQGWVNDKLTTLAQAKKLTPPTAPNEVQTQMVSGLISLHGSAFDKAYLNDQAMLHQQAVTLYRTEAQQGTDPDVKAFAASVLPRLEQHLSMVEKLGGHAPTS